ncbi:hypothetical protein [Streptomyces sp. NPDC060001]|uniref:DUF6197 family protein n=1 Tax=Streptomyces sp. NPDC060001 TaxID=3347032 RepID=UPI00369C5548
MGIDATRTARETRTAPTPPALPACPPPRRHPAGPALPAMPTTPAETPTWGHRFLPATLRRTLSDLGLWQDPTPQPPSVHLEQTLAVLHRYGWCRSQDVTPTGRMCIRGAQQLLQKTGHVTPHARERAVAYMQTTLAQAGVHMQFFAWNDLPDQQFSSVQTLLETAARAARQNGE